MASTEPADVHHRTEVASRLREQARSHWFEFSIIVASVNAASAMVLLSTILVGERTATVTALSCLILAASVTCAMLAYYSIQLGTLLVFGPIRLGHVLTSFAVAGSQLSLFLWPDQVLDADHTDLFATEGLRHWLAFYAIFAFAAAISSKHATLLRSAQGLLAVFPAYERSQRFDRRAAVASGLIVLACYLGSLWHRVPFTVAGVGVAAFASLLGLRSQSRASVDLSIAAG